MKQLITALACVALCAIAQAQAGARIAIERPGHPPSTANQAEHFSGPVAIDLPFQSELPGRFGGAVVTFQPGARTAWHTHPLGQTLIVTTGIGLVQQWGGLIQEIRPGDVVSIPPGVKHWHGASPTTAMTHIAIAEQQDGKSVEWLEKVGDSEYPRARPTTAETTGPTTAQRLFGDVNPKLAQLTDDVLFGDVWVRPGLSPRDRSLVTVSALIAMNRPDQLRSHLQRALDNGLSETELVEAITHLAFYAGWPSAVTASTVAKDVFRKNWARWHIHYRETSHELRHLEQRPADADRRLRRLPDSRPNGVRAQRHRRH
jgi:4-carboxymuconolactone decarboxylase